jgi:hypothetical protein
LQLYDDLSTNHVTANPHNPKIAPVVKKVFDQYGKEITNVHDLEYDQEIWVSFGEPFINPFSKYSEFDSQIAGIYIGWV